MMKKLLFLGLLGGLFSTSTANAQIYYETGFEDHLYNPSHGWSGNFNIASNNSYVCTGSRTASRIVSSEGEASLISPSFNSDGTEMTLSFKYKVGSGYSWQPITPVEGNQFDIKIEYSTDDGTNWTTKENLNTSHTATADCTERTVTFAAGEASQGTVKFRFFVKNRTNPPKTLNFSFDDIIIMQSASAPECPSNVTFTENRSGCGNYGGKITWNSSAMASSYEVKVGTTPGGSDIYNDSQTSTEYNIDSSTLGQTFYYTIKAHNSLGTSSDCTEYSYTMPTTGCYCEASSTYNSSNYIKSFSTTGATSNIDNQNNGYNTPGYTDYSSMSVESYADGVFNFKINTSGGDDRANIWIDYNQNYIFEENERVINSLTAVDGEISDIISIPTNTANGSYRMRIRTGRYVPIDACGERQRGETEDYTLIVSDAPNCIPANQLTATLDSTYAANLSWSGDNAGIYQMEWGTANFTQGEGTTIDNISGTSYSLTGFPTLNTNYSYYVRKKCSETEYSIWAGPYTFYVGYCIPAISNNDENGISKVVINDHEYTQGDVTYANHYNDPVELNAGTTIPVSITFETNSTQRYGVWLDKNDNFTFESDERLAYGSVNNTPTTYTFTIDIPANISEGIHHLRIYSSNGYNGTQDDPCYESTYMKAVLLDFAVNITNNPVCVAPSGLNVENISGGKKLKWNGNGTDYSVEYGAEGFAQGSGTTVEVSTNEYAVTNFPTLNANYQFYVRNNCASGATDWVGPYTFYHGYCKPYIDQNDDDGIPKVIINAHEYTQGDVIYANHYNDPVELNAGTTIPVSITFSMGATQNYGIWLDKNDNLTFDSDERLAYGSVNNTPTTRTLTIDIPADISEGIHHLRIYASGNFSVQSNPCNDAYRGVLLDFAINITNTPICVAPSGLNVEDISGGKKLKWNGNGTDYSVEYGVEGFAQGSGTIVNNISSNEYSVTDFPTIDTNYQFYVRNNCASGASDWVGPYTFFYGYCQAQPSSNDGNGISKFTINTEEFTQGDVTYFDHTATPVDVQQGMEIPVEIVFETAYAYHNKVWVDMNKNLIFDADEMFDLGVSTNTNPTTFISNFTLPISLENGTYRMRFIGYDRSRNNPCYTGDYAVALDFTLNVSNNPVGTISQELESLKMYPNPADDRVSISCKEVIDSIEIFDINGRKVHQQDVNHTSTIVDVSALASGSYMIRINSNNKSNTQQLIVK